MVNLKAVPAKGFVADLAAANADQIVVLHRWADGMILVMMFDDQMPGFTAKLIPRGEQSLESVRGKDAVITATGYVFWVVAPDAANGPIEFENQRYSYTEIYDYVVWTDERAVRAKYGEVLARAARE